MFPVLKRATTAGFAAALVLGVAAAAVAGHILFTASGSERAARWFLSRYVGSDQVTIQGAYGSLVRGLSLYEMEIKEVAGLPPGAILHLRRLDVPPVARALGSVSLYDLEVQGLPELPSGTALKIQRIDAAFPPRLERIRAVYNGRLQLPLSEPVVFSGTRKGKYLDAGVYSKALDVREWLRILSAGGALREVSGSLVDVQAHVSGPLEEPTVEGTFRIAQLTYRHFELTDCPGSLRLQMRSLKAYPQLVGDISCQSGTIAARNTTVKLQPSRISYSGDPLAPSFALRGTATVEGTRIALALTGTPENPQLALSSDPPMSQRRLLLMVATGKSWKETEGALAQGQLSTDLVKDFLDYFVLGGLGSKLTRSFGISDVSLMYDSQTRAKGIGVTIGDRLETQYEIQPADVDPTEAASASVSERQADLHKVGVEYRVTSDTSVELEGQREAPAPHQPSTQIGQTEQADVRPDEQLLLKIKKQF